MKQQTGYCEISALSLHHDFHEIDSRCIGCIDSLNKLILVYPKRISAIFCAGHAPGAGSIILQATTVLQLLRFKTNNALLIDRKHRNIFTIRPIKPEHPDWKSRSLQAVQGNTYR